MSSFYRKIASIFIICAFTAFVATIVGTPTNNDVNDTSIVLPEHERTEFVTFIKVVSESNITNAANSSTVQAGHVKSTPIEDGQPNDSKTKGLLLNHRFPTARPIIFINTGDLYINSTFIQNMNTNSTLTNNTNNGANN